MIYMKKNSLLTALLFFFTAPIWSQVFNNSVLKIKATDLYYQGVYPNVDQGLALYEDFNHNAVDL